jgi:hypothetical protein
LYSIRCEHSIPHEAHSWIPNTVISQGLAKIMPILRQDAL